jgi:hypothetical protein
VQLALDRPVWLVPLVMLLAGCDCSLDADTRVPDPPLPTASPDPTRPMGFFFGNLHSHCRISDGTGTPDEAFDWARHKAGYDFYAITDHASQISQDEWESLGRSVAAKEVPGKFVTLRGFEWSHLCFGHVNVFGTDDFVTSLRMWDPDDFYAWIDANGALAQFNHPGRVGDFQQLAFKADLRDNFFAIETANKTDGNSQGRYLRFLPRALQAGWLVAPAANQDNHRLHTTSHRTVIIAPELSRAALLEAMRARRLYSSDDPTLRLTFKYGDHWMGSTVVEARTRYTLEVLVEDDEPILRVELHDRRGRVVRTAAGKGSRLRAAWQVRVTGWDSFFVKVFEQDTRDDAPGQSVQVAVSAPIWFFARQRSDQPERQPRAPQ